jgi:hypothetical protein
MALEGSHRDRTHPLDSRGVLEHRDALAKAGDLLIAAGELAAELLIHRDQGRRRDRFRLRAGLPACEEGGDPAGAQDRGN